MLIHCDESVVLFVDVQVLNDAFSKEVLEVFQSKSQVLNVFLGQLRPSFLADYQRSDQSASICSDVDAIELLIVVH